MTMTSLELSVSACDEADRGTQICRLCVAHMDLLKAKLGCYVKISHSGKTAVCSLWPSTSQDDDCVKLDKTVLVYPTADRPACKTTSKIEVIGASNCIHLKVTVILNDISEVKKLRQTFKQSKELEEHCKNCLLLFCVVPEAHVNLEHSKLAQCYGYSGLYIHSVKSGKDTEGAVVTINTDIEISQIVSKERFELRKTQGTCKLGGLAKAMSDLMEIIRLDEKRSAMGIDFMEFPRGVLLRGPPGCGKTTLVRQIASQCDAFLITINGPEVLRSRPGESEEILRGVFARACGLSEEGPCILFIDEIDSLCPRRGRSSSSQESRVTGQLLSLMDGLGSRARITVIGATNRPHALDPAVRRPGRFDREVMINIPTEAQRTEILQVHSSCLPLAEDVDFSELSVWTKGYVGADLSNLCQEAAYLAMAETKLNQESSEVTKVGMKHFKAAFGRMVPSSQRGSDALVDLKPVDWCDVGGLSEVKSQIRQAVEWPLLHPEAFKRLGVPHPRGILLYGPPGCCKTTLVRAAATSSKATFLSVSSAQLFSPFVGDAERTVTEIFQRARMGAPSILFLDEVDAIAGKRSESGRQRGVQERLLSTLLNEMDGVGMRVDDKFSATRGQCERVAEGDGHRHRETEGLEAPVDNSSVLVVAATNRPDLVDEALLRPGRFDRIIYVPHPESQAREQILSVYLRRMPAVGVDVRGLAELTEGFTGADLENLCREAALLALTQDGPEATTVTDCHFTEALTFVKPSLNAEVVKQYQNLKGHLNRR